MKIVINKCFGGFSVTEAVFNELGIAWEGYGDLRNEHFGIESDNRKEYRGHPKLIAAIEKIGKQSSSGEFANLDIREIPDNIKWEIDEDDGKEAIVECHRSWF